MSCGGSGALWGRAGTIKLATLKDDLFTPGKTYQVDFSEVS